MCRMHSSDSKLASCSRLVNARACRKHFWNITPPNGRCEAAFVKLAQHRGKCARSYRELKNITYYSHTRFRSQISGVERRCRHCAKSKSESRNCCLCFVFVIFFLCVCFVSLLLFSFFSPLFCQICFWGVCFLRFVFASCIRMNKKYIERDLSRISRRDNNNISLCSYYLIFKSHTK